MSEKICRYCTRKFEPSQYHPDQNVCSSKDCQRQRRTDYHRRKLQEDPVYREQCRHSQQKWREEHPNYMKRYLAKRRRRERSESANSRPLSEVQDILDLVKNNLAFDVRPSTSAIWLLSSAPAEKEKNILA